MTMTALYAILGLAGVGISVRTLMYAREARKIRAERNVELEKLEKAAKELGEQTDDNVKKAEEVNKSVVYLTVSNHIVESLLDAIRGNR